MPTYFPSPAPPSPQGVCRCLIIQRSRLKPAWRDPSWKQAPAPVFCCPPPRGTGRTNPPWHRGCSGTSAAAPAPGCAGEGGQPPGTPGLTPGSSAACSSASWHWVNACLKILNRKKDLIRGCYTCPNEVWPAEVRTRRQPRCTGWIRRPGCSPAESGQPICRVPRSRLWRKDAAGAPSGTSWLSNGLWARHCGV